MSETTTGRGPRIAVVTGAGSGVGRAVTLALAQGGWSVALVGRREEPLHETIGLAGRIQGKLVACPCDISVEAEVEAMAKSARDQLGGDAEVLVNAAGTNTAPRALEQLTTKQFRDVVDVNLVGSFLCVHALLPGMRRLGRGTIVNIVSDAGLIANAKAGAAYVSSKFALTGLTQSINAEERERGIRACAIFPGDINTPLLDKRPTPPPQDARLKMLQPEDVTACVMLAINLPDRAIVEQLLVRPR